MSSCIQSCENKLILIQSTHFEGNPKHSTDPRYETWDTNEYSDGPMAIGFQGFVPVSNVPFIEACNETVHTPILHDLNSGDNRGVKQGTGIIDANFLRSSTYDSYYMRAKGRSNMDVLIRAPVLRINFDGEGDKLTACGVTFLDESSGLVKNVTANLEVISCAGAFQSPQLLMVSVSRALCSSLDLKPTLRGCCIESCFECQAAMQLSLTGVEL